MHGSHSLTDQIFDRAEEAFAEEAFAEEAFAEEAFAAALPFEPFHFSGREKIYCFD